MAGVFVLGEIGHMLEDTRHIEIVPRTQNLQLAHHLVFAGDVLCLVEGFHRLVHTGDTIEVVLPLVLQTDVIGGYVRHLQLVDIRLHGNGTATFVGIVGTNIENPVGAGSCKCLVVAEIVRKQARVGRCQQTIHRLIGKLVGCELSVRTPIEKILATGQQD